MGKIAFVFSGQGAQYSGMGQEICEVSEAAGAVFTMADSMRPGTSTQCFESSKEELSVTINTQPCVFTVDLACAAALREAGIKPDGAAGFSLGELAALSFCGMLTEKEAFSVVCKRAELMEECGVKNKGSMAAVLRLENGLVEKLCRQAGVYPVNYNCEGQLVAAGAENDIINLILLAGKNGGKALKLPVSGAFHSPHMEEAVAGLQNALTDFRIKKPAIPLYANVTAEPYGDNPTELLTKQVVSPVQWQKTIENMVRDGFDTFVEVGPGKTLTTLIKKISPESTAYNVENKDSLKATIDALSGGCQLC